MLEKKYNRKHIGVEFVINSGYKGKVIDGGSKMGYCTIQIGDWISEVAYKNTKTGKIKYPYHKSVYGTGYLGEGIYSKSTHKDIYDRLNNMLERCYSNKFHKIQPTYKGVTVCDDWHNFQVFAKWYEKYYPKDGNRYELDKDLLSRDNKIYSSQTCLFIDRPLNKFMANVRKDNTSGYTGVCWCKNEGK